MLLTPSRLGIQIFQTVFWLCAAIESELPQPHAMLQSEALKIASEQDTGPIIDMNGLTVGELNNFALLETSRGHPAAACELLHAAVRVAPRHAGTYNNLANAQCAGASLLPAQYAAIAVKLSPGSSTYRFTLGTRQHQSGQLQQVCQHHVCVHSNTCLVA